MGIVRKSLTLHPTLQGNWQGSPFSGRQKLHFSGYCRIKFQLMMLTMIVIIVIILMVKMANNQTNTVTF